MNSFNGITLPEAANNNSDPKIIDLNSYRTQKERKIIKRRLQSIVERGNLELRKKQWYVPLIFSYLQKTEQMHITRELIHDIDLETNPQGVKELSFTIVLGGMEHKYKVDMNELQRIKQETTIH